MRRTPALFKSHIIFAETIIKGLIKKASILNATDSNKNDVFEIRMILTSINYHKLPSHEIEIHVEALERLKNQPEFLESLKNNNPHFNISTLERHIDTLTNLCKEKRSEESRRRAIAVSKAWRTEKEETTVQVSSNPFSLNGKLRREVREVKNCTETFTFQSTKK